MSADLIRSGRGLVATLSLSVTKLLCRDLEGPPPRWDAQCSSATSGGKSKRSYSATGEAATNGDSWQHRPCFIVHVSDLNVLQVASARPRCLAPDSQRSHKRPLWLDQAPWGGSGESHHGRRQTSL